MKQKSVFHFFDYKKVIKGFFAFLAFLLIVFPVILFLLAFLMIILDFIFFMFIKEVHIMDLGTFLLNQASFFWLHWRFTLILSFLISLGAEIEQSYKRKKNYWEEEKIKELKKKEEERKRKKREEIKKIQGREEERKRKERAKFEKQQKAKGLVGYKDKWLRPQDVKKLREIDLGIDKNFMNVGGVLLHYPDDKRYRKGEFVG